MACLARYFDDTSRCVLNSRETPTPSNANSPIPDAFVTQGPAPEWPT